MARRKFKSYPDFIRYRLAHPDFECISNGDFILPNTGKSVMDSTVGEAQVAEEWLSRFGQMIKVRMGLIRVAEGAN